MSQKADLVEAVFSAIAMTETDQAVRVLTNLSVDPLSRLKFELQDNRADDDWPDLQPLRERLANLHAAIHETSPALTEGETYRWVDDLLGLLGGTGGQDEPVTFLGTLRDAVSGTASDRDIRFADGGPLDLKRVYARLQSLQHSMLEGGATPTLLSALGTLRTAVEPLSEASDKPAMYLRAYVADVFHFLRDEKLLDTVDTKERARIDSFLDT